MRLPTIASTSPPSMNYAGPSLVRKEGKTSAKHQRVVGSMYDAGLYPAPKEGKETPAKRQRIAARHER